MKKIKRFLLLMASGFASLGACAQNSPTDANPRSDVSLQGSGKMGDIYNVNLYDGTVNVNIPIYDYSIDGLNLGVSLGYDGRGIKIDQAASSVGLNWSLLAGGYIERTIRGVPDETHPIVLAHHATGNNPPHTTPCANDAPLFTDIKGPWCWAFGNQNVHDDLEHDLFEVNMGGSSFKMNIAGISYDSENNLTAVSTYPKREVKVQVKHNGSLLGIGPAFTGLNETDSSDHIDFEIVDEKGNRFYFSPGDIEYSYYTAPEAVNPYYRYRTQRWVLTKITTVSGNTVVYHYRRFNNVTFPYYKDQQIKERYEHNEVIANVSTPFTDTIKIVADSIVWWSGIVSHVSKIDYPNGTNVIFNFEDDPNHKRCDQVGKEIVKSIRIESKLDNTNTINSKTYRFNYAYFHSPINTNSNIEIAYAPSCDDIKQTFGFLPSITLNNHLILGLRLKLKSIDIIGTDNVTTLPYYAFEYNNTPLPERLSPSQDYFGYYNGKSPVFSVSGVSNPPDLSNFGMPLHTYVYKNGNSITYGVDRTPDINYMGAFNLKKIVNGMGGEIEFSFKDHGLYNPANSYNNYNNPLPTNYQGDNANDGLCIDYITFRDGYNIDNTTTTKYEFADGQRFFRGGYFWKFEYGPMGDHEIGYNPNNPDQSGTVLYFRDYITPLLSINGSNHGYSYATIKSYGYNNELLGSVKYKFSNLINPNGSSNLQMKMPIQPWQHCFHPEYFSEYKMGLPLEVSTYDVNGDLLSKTENVYTKNNSIPGYAYAYPNSRNTGEGGGTYANSVDAYEDFYSYKMVKTGTTSTTYAGQNTITSTMNLTYDSVDNLTTASWTDANGDINTKKFFYNYTQVNGQPLINNSSYSTNRQYLLTTEIWKNSGGSDYILSYKSATPPAMPPYGLGSNNYRSLKTGAPLSLAQYNSASFLNTNVTEDQFLIFDDKANIIETKRDGGLVYDAAIWDTRIGKKIADVSNAHYSQIAYTSFEGSYGPSGTFEYSKGNWDFDPASIVYSFVNGLVRPMTGKYHYQLAPAGSPISGFNTLQSGVNYQLSFWATNMPNVSVGSQGIAMQVVAQKQYWKLYTAKIVGNGGNIVISSPSSTISIDELRLHPYDAKMTTATYEPLFGPNSQTDANNNVTYYQYDAMGNVKVMRDIDGNIRSLTKQVIQGSDN